MQNYNIFFSIFFKKDNLAVWGDDSLKMQGKFQARIYPITVI